MTGPSKNYTSIDTEALDIGGRKAQALADGFLVPFAPTLGVEDAIDPANETNPIQAAIDVFDAAGETGTIRWVGDIPLTATVNMSQGVSLQGAAGIGDFPSGTGGSQITIDPGVSEAFVFDGNSGSGELMIDNVVIQGPGFNEPTTTDVFVFRTNTFSELHFGRIAIVGLYGRAMHGESGSVFQSTLGEELYIRADSGDDPAMIDMNIPGPQNRMGLFMPYPDSRNSGLNSLVLRMGGGLDVQTINAGGDGLGQLGSLIGDSSTYNVGSWSWEPEHSDSITRLWRVDRNATVGPGFVVGNGANTPSVGWVYELNGSPSGNTLHKPLIDGSVTLTADYVEVSSDTADEDNIYHGLSTELVNNSGTSPLTNDITCLSDLAQFSG